MQQHAQANKKLDKARTNKRPDGAPYDRGYAWVIVAMGSLIMLIMAGVQRSSGIFFMEIQQKYGSSSAKTSFVYGLRYLTAMMASLPSRLLIERIGTRYVVMLGGLLTALGNIVAMFSESLYMLMFSMGFLTGLGASMLHSPVLVLVCSYFKKHRSIASGLTVSGNSIGGMLFPGLIYGLLDEYELQGSFLLCGGIMLQICIFGAFLRPLEYYAKHPVRRKKPVTPVKSIDTTSKISTNDTMLDKSTEKTTTESQTPCDEQTPAIEPTNAAEATEPEQSALERCLMNFTDCEMAMPLEAYGYYSELTQRRAAKLGASPEDVKCKSQELCSTEPWAVPRRCTSLAFFFNSPEIERGAPNCVLSGECETDDASVGQLAFEYSRRSSGSSSGVGNDADAVLSIGGKSNDNNAANPEPQKRRKFCDIARSLLKNRLYLTIVICQACYSESFKTLLICFPPHIVNLKFLKESTVHFLLVMHFCDLAGRLASIAISSLIQRKCRRFTKRHAYIFCLHLYSCSVILLALCGRHVPLIYLSISLMGFTSGFATANYTVVLAECCKIRIEDLGIAHSLSLFVQSIFILTLTVGLGSLTDLLGTWKWSILTCGILTNLGCLVGNSNVYSALLRRFRNRARASSQSPTRTITTTTAASDMTDVATR